MMLGIITFIITVIVGLAWLFDATPVNLIKVWKFVGSCFAISLLFQALFGAPITFK